jgi:hypothetical protein
MLELRVAAYQQDVHDMQIGSYDFYAYYENRKEATGSASTRTRGQRFVYHRSHPEAAVDIILQEIIFPRPR